MINKKMGIRDFKKYTPIFPIAPGETLLEAIEERGMNQAELAKRMGRPTKVINEIIKGKTAITPETAIQLEQVLGIPARFWNNLESNYQELKARLKSEKTLKLEISNSEKYPYNEMMKLNWVPYAQDKYQRAGNMLQFFGVTSLEIISENQLLQCAYYRKSRRNFSIPSAVAWLRKGILDGQSISTKKFDENKLKENINNVRGLTLERAEVIQEKLRELFSNCGLAFVVTPGLKNVPINGVSRWISPDKALIQLSIFYKFRDIFWFSLFHEIGHILLHNKKDINIDFSVNKIEDEKEKEADRYAANILIPEEKINNFVKNNCFSEICIKNFSAQENIHPGIVIGRLQHMGKLPYNAFSHLRPRFTWEKPTGI